MGFKYCVDEMKYKANNNCIQIEGWGFEISGAEVAYLVFVEDQEAAYEIDVVKRIDVEEIYSSYGDFEKNGFCIKVYLKEKEVPSSLRIMIFTDGEQEVIVNLKKKALIKIYNKSTFLYNIDRVNINDKKVMVDGWVVSENGIESIKFQVKDSGKRDLITKIRIKSRPDLADMQGESSGFQMEFARTEDLLYSLFISDGCTKTHIKLNVKKLLQKQNIKGKLVFIKQVLRYFGKNGFAGLNEYIVFIKKGEGKFYGEWFKEHTLSLDELQKQRDVVFKQPLRISIIVMSCGMLNNNIKEVIDSIRKQTYQNWELYISVSGGTDRKKKNEIEKYRDADSRIKYCVLEENLKIADIANEALKSATGDYIGFMNQADVLAPNALYEIAKELQDGKSDIIYTDEDAITIDNKRHTKPEFKPDFSIDLLRSYNYIGNFFVVKSSIIRKVGGFRREFDGARNYDMLFRCVEASRKIKHIPRVLYHCKMYVDLDKVEPFDKDSEYEVGRKVLEEHLKRVGIKASVKSVGLSGKYHVKYKIQDNPLVSVIIPNKEHMQDLDKCITSLYEKSDYRNFEIIVVENNSESEETFLYYEQMQERYDNLHVVMWDKEFNYSRINNFGVQHAHGDYLLFLNNDTEMISSEAITEMLGCCMREEVGAVGAKLLYGDNTVQHAGVVIGFGNYAGHVNTGIKRNDGGYMMRASVNCNYSAVTAACMMTKRQLFEQVGGFDEQFVVACNDVDYCLQLRKLGKMIVFNAFSEWYHYESKSRGYEDTDEKIKRFEGEVEKFQKKWEKILKEGDPYYNKNFSITQSPFTLG